MFPTTPVTLLSETENVTAVSAAYAMALAPGRYYVFVSSTACWIKQGAAPTASAADGSMYVPAGVVVVLSGNDGVALAVIRDAADGKASLTPARL